MKVWCCYFFNKIAFYCCRRREPHIWPNWRQHIRYNRQKAGAIVARRRFKSVDGVHGLWHLISRFEDFYFCLSLTKKHVLLFHFLIIYLPNLILLERHLFLKVQRNILAYELKVFITWTSICEIEPSPYIYF